MSYLKKILKWLFVLCASLYIVGCSYLYFEQEHLIFHPDRISVAYKYRFTIPFEEIFLKTRDNVKLNCLLFKSQQKESKGLVFFLHGNAGNLNDQATPAEFYTKLGYDFFVMDYRTFGKSGGEIESEKQFYSDIELAYSEMKKRYKESSISVFGYSVGTGPAAMLASISKPKQLVLIAPYYNMMDMALERYKLVPEFILEYKFETNKFVSKTKVPITIFHGDKDDVIPFHSSIRLTKLIKKTDHFFPLKNQDHNLFEQNKIFIKEITKTLDQKK